MQNLVLIPGLLCTDRLFAHQIQGLADIAKITVADHAGADSMAAIAAGILAAAPPRFALAGLSMGGYLAFEILRQSPERVTHLALLDTSARPDLPEQTEMRHRLVALARRKGVRTAQQQLVPRLVAPHRVEDAELTAVLMEMAETIGVEGFAHQQQAIATRPDSRPLLREISCPTAVIVGSEDQLTPPAIAEEMASLIPSVRLAVISGAGHLSTLEAPDEVTSELRRWLLHD